MPSFLAQSLFLGGAADRRSLELACAELAAALSRRLREQGLGYLEARLEAEAEGEAARAESRFPRVQAPARLGFHLSRLASRLAVSGPVERLSAAVAGLSPLPAEQLALFGARNRLIKARLERLMREAGREHRLAPASSLEEDRREKMLAFYDPLRRRGRGGI